jgi:membrane-associated phospholipid phosphatase
LQGASGARANETPMREPAAARESANSPSNILLIREHRAAMEFAKALSTIFNPFLSATALFVIVAHAFSRSTVEFWKLSAEGLFFFTIAPLVCVLYLYVTGRISDFDMSDRPERERVFATFVVIYFVAAMTLTINHAPVQFIAITWGYWGTAVLTMIITRWWKISTHAFGIAGPFAVMFLLFQWQPLPYAIVVPLVCWARVYLRSHTLAQVVTGAGIAVLSTLIFFKLFHLV